MDTLLARFRTIKEADKTHAVRQLVEDATPDFDYTFMLVLSVLMATFGLLAGSETVVVGGMLLAPLLAPVVALALGIAIPNHHLVGRSVNTIGKSFLFAVGASVAATFLFSFSGEASVNSIILSRTEPSLFYIMVAIVSGLAVSYAIVKPNISATLPAIAIAVALVPPLSVVGIGIAWFNFEIVSGALLMFLINIVGIVLASMAMFSFMDVHHKRFLADHTIAQEEKRVAEEKKEVEEAGAEATITTSA